MLLWLIDDTQHHHQVAAATAAQVPSVVFQSFVDGGSGEWAFTEAVRAGAQPDVVLMDFFLGDDRGDQVTRRLRRLERERRSVIIGYSSVQTGSQAIVNAGGDLILPKRGNASGINPQLLAWLQRWPG